MKVSELNDFIYSFAPSSLCSEWDNTGIMIGDPSSDVSKAVLCLDVTEGAVKFAVQNGADVIISHHPLFYSDVKSITVRDRVGRAALEAIKNGIAVLSHHTNMDNSPVGLNATFASMCGGTDIETISDGALFNVDTTLLSLAKKISETFKTCVKVSSGNLDRQIKKAFVVTGCGGRERSLFEFARLNADVYITGEIKHNCFLDYCSVIEIPHYSSEIIFCDVTEKLLKGKIEVVKYFNKPFDEVKF